MKENCTTQPLDSGALIVICQANKIIARILPPHSFMAGGEGQGNSTVVTSMAYGVAPSVSILEWLAA
jgi:hypothetical protein